MATGRIWGAFGQTRIQSVLILSRFEPDSNLGWVLYIGISDPIRLLV